MKRLAAHWAIVTALGAAIVAAGHAAPRTQSPSPAPLTVLTYNIRYANPRDGDNIWENRREAMVAYVNRTNPDVIGFQEVEPAQRAYLAERLTDYAWYGVGRNAAHDEGEGTPIFYRRSRFDVLDRGTFWLSTTPETPGSKGWDAALPRVASWIKVRDRRTDGTLLLVNTHFDHMGPTARLESAHLLTRRIDDLARAGTARLPVILTGDFNCRPDSEPYAAVTKPANAALTMIDTQQLSRTPHQGGDSTTNAFTAISPGATIDYVFVRDVARVESHRVEDPRINGRFVSDHQPLVAVIEAGLGRR